MKRVVIIGNGIAGVTAARNIRKISKDEILIISGETDYFFSRTALMYVYMGHMNFENTQPYEYHFWKKNKIDLLNGWVEEIQFENKKVFVRSKIKKLKTDVRTTAVEGEWITYDTLILATGSKPNFYNWPGQDAIGVQGLYSYQDLQQLETTSKQGIKKAVIVGGGLIGIELAEMLLTRKIEVTFLVRENSFWRNVLPQQDSALVTQHVQKHHVHFKFNTSLKEIYKDEQGRVKSILTDKEEKIECDFVGITTGVSPNISFLKNTSLKTDKGILVNEYLQTNIADVYAIGDCTERTYTLPGRRNIEQVWYTGRMMGEVVAQTICGKPTRYEPGPWFNSAKFFDLEYQTYGNVEATCPADENEFYWQDEHSDKAVHLRWKKEDKLFTGINTFGIRMRHAFFDQCLRDRKSVYYIIENLTLANFDPEFFKRYESQIQSDFAQKHTIDNSFAHH